MQLCKIALACMPGLIFVQNSKRTSTAACADAPEKYACTLEVTYQDAEPSGSSPSTLQVRSAPEYTDNQGPLRLLPALRPARAGLGRWACSDAEAASPAADAHTEAQSSASIEDATLGASCCSGSAMPLSALTSASPAPSCSAHWTHELS